MTISVNRRPATDGVILSEVFLDGLWECYGLEREDVKIPAGRYRVVITRSQRFGTMLPLLVNVPGREGIRIHAGNSGEDTAGCLLLGQMRGTHTVLQSRRAMEALQGRLAQALAQHGDAWIDVRDPGPDTLSA